MTIPGSPVRSSAGHALAAVDLGATSGRVILGHLSTSPTGTHIDLEQVARFVHDPLPVEGELHWNIARLFNHTRAGLTAAHTTAQRRGTDGLAGIGVDTWGVDYGLLNHAGALLGDPFNYRDARTDNIPNTFFGTVPPQQLYARCGLQVQPFNTIFQLVAAAPTTPWDDVAQLLLMPDLFSHWLTGAHIAEVTNASTTGLLDAHTRQWSPDTLADLDHHWHVPAQRILPDLVEPGTVIGSVKPDLLTTQAHVVAVCSHDTASAIASIPATGNDFAYISSGTWSLVGLELPTPVLTEASRHANFTNELGADHTVRYLKNVMGLWVLTEAMHQWDKDGLDVDLPTLLEQASRLPALRTVIDINDPSLLPPGDMPARIAHLATAAGQPVPHTPAEFTRCILDSLALAYRLAVRTACTLADRDVRVVHIVGGGSNNTLLCQLTAEATGLEVIAGPAEGTALGNLLIQGRALGAIHGDLDDLRAIVRNSIDLTTYRPGLLPDLDEPAWHAAEQRAGL